MFTPFNRGIYTRQAVLVPGMTTGSGGKFPPLPVVDLVYSVGGLVNAVLELRGEGIPRGTAPHPVIRALHLRGIRPSACGSGAKAHIQIINKYLNI